MAKLRISSDLALPPEAVTEKLAFLGRTGSGKTYAAQKLAEEMHAAAAQFVVLDPVGVWYGLRLAADGKKPGLPVPVLGGLRGDIPLEPTGGALIANLVVDRGTSVVLDVSQFESDADKARFATAFADRFFFRKKASPSAVHVFIEECQEFVPQNPMRDDARMLHAFTRLVKIGRNFGIGVSLISQRPQEVNKKVLNLTELLFAFQLTGPQERKTIEGWIADKGLDEDIAGELPKLTVGHPHVWSPAWLKISRVIAIATKTTFDASSTPVVGKSAAARELSPIDLAQLRTEMAATIEKAKAEDPKLLRARIAELEKNLKALKNAGPAPQPGKPREISVLKTEHLKRLETALARADGSLGNIKRSQELLARTADDITAATKPIVEELRKLRAGPAAAPPGKPILGTGIRSKGIPAKVSQRPPAAPPSGDLTGSQQRVVDVAADLVLRGITPTRDAIARWIPSKSKNGLHPTGGRYGSDLAHLRELGVLDGCMPTASGQATARPLTRGLDGVREVVSGSQWRIVETLLAAGQPLTRDALAEQLGLHPTGGRYGSDLARLRTMGVITDRGPIAVTEGAHA